MSGSARLGMVRGHGVRKPHVLPASVLIGTWTALVVLTVVTVLVSRYNLGQFNVLIALGIASSKAALVALFFMHLKYDYRFHLVVLVASVFFAVLLAMFVLFDTRQYQPSLRLYGSRAAHSATSGAQ